MSRRRALITGITGQDGSYLAELLLDKDYEVFGMTRRASTENIERIAHLADRVTLIQGDLLDPPSLDAALRTAQPAEVYNLAAQSFVPTSWNQPVLTAEFTAVGVTRMLEAIRAVDPAIRFYQASSSEMFGKVREVPQNELSPFHPRSPYGVAKVYGHHITVNYRESYGLFAVGSWASQIVRLEAEGGGTLLVGDLSAERDLIDVRDVCRAYSLLLDPSVPAGTYNVASGRAVAMRRVLELLIEHAAVPVRVEQDNARLRPADIPRLAGDPARLRAATGWEPGIPLERTLADTLAAARETVVTRVL